MKSHRSAAGLAIILGLLVCATAFGQQSRFEVALWTTQLQPQNVQTVGGFVEPETMSIRGNSVGYGLGASYFWTRRLSTELAVSTARSDAEVHGFFVGPQFDTVRVMPVTGVVQFHLRADAPIDPYAGIGAAYIFFHESGPSAARFKNEPALVLDAGFRVRMTPHLALSVDGKYLPSRTVVPADSLGRQTARFRALSIGVAIR